MRTSYILLWRCTVVLLWILSEQAIVRAGFQPIFGLYSSPGHPNPYPWGGVTLMSLVTVVECTLLYLLLHPQKFAWSPSRLGIAFGVFFVFSIGAVITLLTFDLPAYVYVPSEFTILVTLLLLLLLIITTSISLVRRISKGTLPI